jgi:hypothetical protein
MTPISVRTTERAVHRSHADRLFSLTAALNTIKKEIGIGILKVQSAAGPFSTLWHDYR